MPQSYKSLPIFINTPQYYLRNLEMGVQVPTQWEALAIQVLLRQRPGPAAARRARGRASSGRPAQRRATWLYNAAGRRSGPSRWHHCLMVRVRVACPGPELGRQWPASGWVTSKCSKSNELRCSTQFSSTGCTGILTGGNCTGNQKAETSALPVNFFPACLTYTFPPNKWHSPRYRWESEAWVLEVVGPSNVVINDSSPNFRFWIIPGNFLLIE